MTVLSASAPLSTIVVAVDVGKTSAMVSATDSARVRVLGPVEFAMTRSGLAATVSQVSAPLSQRLRRSRLVSRRLGIITGRCWTMGGHPDGRCSN